MNSKKVSIIATGRVGKNYRDFSKTINEDYLMDIFSNIVPDSLLNFELCYAIRSYLRTNDDSFGTAHDIERTINSLSSFPPKNRERPYYNPTPGLDGIQANRKMISFFENHDGINRFRVSGVSVFLIPHGKT